MKKRYPAIAQQIMEEIRSGAFSVGDPMPSEAELCARFEASRSAVRGALAILQKLGVIERKQGAATRIRATEAAPTYVHSMTATGDLMEFAGPSWRKVHRINSIVADEALAERLDKRPGRRWLHISQTRHIDSQPNPVGWTDVYLSAEYPDIAEDIGSYPGLVYSLLEERHGILIQKIRQSINAVPVPEAIAERLEVQPGDPALELTRNYLDAEERSLIVSLSILPSKSYSYEITLTRQA